MWKWRKQFEIQRKYNSVHFFYYVKHFFVDVVYALAVEKSNVRRRSKFFFTNIKIVVI